MIFNSSILALSLITGALQVGPNPNALPLTNGHDELAERAPRAPEQANADPSSIWLAECLAVLDQDASRAHTLAQLHRNAHSGADRVLANHCLGLAATELNLWQDAITAFTAARDETPADELSARSRFALMAGNAALASGDATGANGLLGEARALAQQASAGTLEAIAATDLARAQVALNLPESALQSLETATRLDPANPESWLLKATLLRRLDRLDDAQLAIEQAGINAPRDPLVGLEAGVIAILAGRDAAARASWQSVIDLGPQSPAARTAQDYLAQLGPAQAEPAAQDDAEYDAGEPL